MVQPTIQMPVETLQEILDCLIKLRPNLLPGQDDQLIKETDEMMQKLTVMLKKKQT